jgi:hypothetical protein
MALYSNLAKDKIPTGDAAYSQANIAALVNLRDSVWKAVLPKGLLLDALLNSGSDLLAPFRAIQAVLGGRKYRQGHYTLGERLIDQIQCQNGNPNTVGWKDVPDDVVPLARLFFTMVFGVRISTIEDLDALNGSTIQQGVANYLARNPDQPYDAVYRAANIKQNCYPDRYYNTTCWDLGCFDENPLIAPVPEMNADMFSNDGNVGKFYTGPGFNDIQFVDGYPVANSPTTGLTSQITPGGSSNSSSANTDIITKIVDYAKANPIIAALVVGGVGFLLYEYSDEL